MPLRDRKAMAANLERGASIDDMLRMAPGWLPSGDRYFISAGAATGKLPGIFKQLADQYDNLASQTTKLVFACIYPLAIVHIAALLLPVVSQIQFQEEGMAIETAGYLKDVLTVIIPLWLLLGGVVFLYRQRPGALYSIGRWIPLAAKSLRFRALANFCRSLGIFLEAGLRIDHAWAGATLMSSDPKVRNQARSAERVITAGSSPLKAVRQLSAFPAEFESFYAAGERTGQLPENMLRLADRFDQKARNWTISAIAVYPSLLFAAIAVYIAITVLSFYSSYFKFIESM